MAKFAIKCPSCGSYAEGKTGFFARKKILCSCGYEINVKTEKLATCVCSHCGNAVVYDQTKGESTLCPVCHENIHTVSEQKKSFYCAQCGVRLTVSSNDKKTIECPVCDCVNNIEERIMAEKIREEGLVSVIKYEGDNDTFVWKHPIEDFNYGSQLIVHASQEAIFFKDGQALDTFREGRYGLETQQLPLLEKAFVMPLVPDKTFHAEVYFINQTVQMAIKWGTPEKVRFIDPITDAPIELGVSGELNLAVSNSRKLVTKLVGTMKGISWGEREGFTKSLQASFRPMIAQAVKTSLPMIINEESIDVFDIDRHLDTISGRLLQKILPAFEDYGLTIPQFYVTSILLPDEREDLNFKKIKELHGLKVDTMLQTGKYEAEATVKTAKAQSETKYRTAEEESRAAIETARRAAELEKQDTETEIARKEAERMLIRAQAEAQAKRLDGLTDVEIDRAHGLADAEVMSAKGYSQKDVLQADVQKAYAAGIGNMGANVSGGGGSGIAGDIMGLGVGMAAINSIMPQVSGMMQGFNLQQTSAEKPQTGAADTWDCECGNKGVTGNFCNNCGKARPKPAEADTWDCECGNKGVTGNFCNMCGAKRPVKDAAWDCACGNKGIIGNFCNICGSKKPEMPAVWDCTCGQKGITGDFCNNCGKKRGE